MCNNNINSALFNNIIYTRILQFTTPPPPSYDPHDGRGAMTSKILVSTYTTTVVVNYVNTLRRYDA